MANLFYKPLILSTPTFFPPQSLPPSQKNFRPSWKSKFQNRGGVSCRICGLTNHAANSCRHRYHQYNNYTQSRPQRSQFQPYSAPATPYLPQAHIGYQSPSHPFMGQYAESNVQPWIADGGATAHIHQT
ncbi:conserved hypothetical protein [Ricinus communis]|uniref:Uncharacterized protein n=1 Tax=Ricinus communis TaxID=3988 RepID=B9SBS3_RICCO|nr:conserved hypothetical protein [Ricinus communis]